MLAALRELAAATGVDGMVGGQYVDVIGAELDAAGLRELHALKTGRLISASVCVVPILEGTDESETIAYRRFADELGVLFQIVDDILDVTESDERLGKPHGSDERHGKTHLRQPLRPRPGARARRRVPRQGDRGAGRGAAARPTI